jgi:hypothetical protein
MKFKFSGHLQKLFTGIIFCSLASVYVSCQKATDPEPFSNPQLSLTKPKDTAKQYPLFTASIDGSPTIIFTPSKTTGGGNTNLIGTSPYYTVTLTFPSSSGPGTYDYGFAPGFIASIYDGTNTYIANDAFSGTGIMKIDSIPNGKYYGTFNFTGEDAASDDKNAIGRFSYL